MPSSPLYIVLNAASGSGDTDDAFQAIERVLTSAGRAHEILRVEDPAQLSQIAAQAVEKAKLADGIVVAAGGDGTLNAVAQATLGSGCRFGVIPQGTFNYFGRTQGISSDAAEAARALLTARVVPVQVGLVNDRVFLVNASLGLYPQSLEDREQQKQRHGRSRIVAIWAALITIFSGYRPLRIKVEFEGRMLDVRTLTLFVGNNRLQLERVGLAESVKVEEGKLAAIMLRPVNSFMLLWFVVRGAMGKLGQTRGVQHFAFSKLTVAPASGRTRRLKVATDGETTWMNAPVEFKVAPEPLLLLTPMDAVPETAKQ